MNIPNIILASASAYRKEILGNYHLDTEQICPQVDETVLPFEKPRTRARRLGRNKAESIFQQISGRNRWLILASDQVCHMDGTIYHKPGSTEIASDHLRAFSGKWVTFSTSLVLLDHRGQRFETVEDYRLHYRKLSSHEIKDYLRSEQPFDCAGAIKIESYGLSLIKNTAGRDINSVYGLPIIAVFEGLRAMNYSLFHIKKNI